CNIYNLRHSNRALLMYLERNCRILERNYGFKLLALRLTISITRVMTLASETMFSASSMFQETTKIETAREKVN
ncbi:hypothetical protein PMAYCL1PPCAC_20212, partial [Pristionchus mayeri]